MSNDLAGLARPQVVPLSDQTYHSLRRALLHGETAPGMRMVETAIAEQLGVSRTPVREALSRLIIEGWLELHRGKGVVVPGITPEESRERDAVREVLDGYAAREAAVRITDEEVADVPKADVRALGAHRLTNHTRCGTL
jgi:DNA-binding GntR family transcriptional regulator